VKSPIYLEKNLPKKNKFFFVAQILFLFPTFGISVRVGPNVGGGTAVRPQALPAANRPAAQPSHASGV
jgi:hypothetical protein